ncbi:hypothetical protein [Micromonospora sp. NPDC005173]|uniref:hypothetical protein n=1 Tax=Micromonospora sp. NPDC005173 TaxID=3157165 RepID=UPI0033B9E78D
MAFRTWGRLLLTALGVSVLAGAGQLGVAYGFGIVRLTGAFTGTTVNQWPAQLVWVGWFAANAAVVGAVLTGRLARRDGLPTTTGRQLAVGGAAALGATIVAPLCMQPARAAELISVDPVWAVGICAVLGAVIGAGAAIAVLLRPELGWNMAAVAGIVWVLALISVLPSLGTTGPLPTVRLGVLEPSWLDDGAAQRLGLLLLPTTALLAGAATAGFSRWRGQIPLISGATGVAGPALVAFAYLTAGPGDAVDRYQATPYYGALIAVLAGVLGATAAALLRWPVHPRTSDPQAIEPTDILRPLPAGRALPGAEPAGSADDRETVAPTGVELAGTGQDRRDGDSTGTVRTVPAHWDWPVTTASGQHGPVPIDPTGPEDATVPRPAGRPRHHTDAAPDPAVTAPAGEPITGRTATGEPVQDGPAGGRSPRRAGGHTPSEAAPAATTATSDRTDAKAASPTGSPGDDGAASTAVPATTSTATSTSTATTDMGTTDTGTAAAPAPKPRRTRKPKATPAETTTDVSDGTTAADTAKASRPGKGTGAGSGKASTVSRPGKETQGTASGRGTGTPATPVAATGPGTTSEPTVTVDPAASSEPAVTADPATQSIAANTAGTDRATDTERSVTESGSVGPLFGTATAGNPAADRWTPATSVWPVTAASTATPQTNDGGPTASDAATGPEEPEWTPRPRHRAPLPDLGRATRWDAFTAPRPAGPADPEDSSAGPATPTSASPVIPEQAAGPPQAGDATGGPPSADGGAAAPTDDAEQPSRRGRIGGLFRRNRSRADEESQTAPDTAEPLPTQDEEFVDWVAGLSKPVADNEPEQENGRRSLRSTGRHHRD